MNNMNIEYWIGYLFVALTIFGVIIVSIISSFQYEGKESTKKKITLWFDDWNWLISMFMIIMLMIVSMIPYMIWYSILFINNIIT